MQRANQAAEAPPQGDEGTSHLEAVTSGQAVMRIPARSVGGIVAETRQIHTGYRVLWRKRDASATLSRGERPNPRLDRLLLAF